MTDIRELANRRASTAMAVQALGMMNRPTELGEIVVADAQYMILQDAAYKAALEYQDAIRNLSAAELTALATGTSTILAQFDDDGGIVTFQHQPK